MGVPKVRPFQILFGVVDHLRCLQLGDATSTLLSEGVKNLVRLDVLQLAMAVARAPTRGLFLHSL